VVLALLESPRTSGRTRSELAGAVATLSKSSAAGCRSLAEVLGGKAAGKGADKGADETAGPAAGKQDGRQDGRQVARQGEGAKSSQLRVGGEKEKRTDRVAIDQTATAAARPQCRARHHHRATRARL